MASTHGACTPPNSGSAGSSGDPHMAFFNGGHADFRGRNNTVFCLLSALHITVNALFEDRIFVRWGGQIIYGSFMRGIFILAHSESTGADVRIAIMAEEPHTYRLCAADVTLASLKTDCALKSDDLDLGDISVELLPGLRLRTRASGQESTFTHRRLRKPIVNGTVAAPTDPARWFMDTSFRELANDASLSAKYGGGSLVVNDVYPHGIIGQSVDGTGTAVSGKLDEYDESLIFHTSAQAEGAIEGIFTDYIVSTPFGNDFKYSRFGAHGPVAPRNVSLLTGAKVTAKAGAFSGSIERHGAEDA